MLISETWSLSDELRIPSNMLSSMQTVFISDTLIEQEGVMLLASNNTHFCSLASTEQSSAIWDSLGHPDVASKYNTGPVQLQCWLQKSARGGRLWCLDMSQKTLHAYVWQMTQGLIVLYMTGFLRFMKFKARPVVTSCNIKLSKSIAILQRMYLVLVGMLY